MTTGEAPRPAPTDDARSPAAQLLDAPGRWWARFVSWTVRRVLWPTRVSGATEALRSGPLLLAINHVNVVDGPLVYAVTPRTVHFLVKTEMFRGLFGWVLRQLGQIPVDRSRPDRSAMTAAATALRAGAVVGVFPEGARGRGDVAEVRTGIAWLALQTGAPVMPVAVLGTRRSGQPAGTLPRLRGRLHVVLGCPFTIERAPTATSGRQALAAAAEDVRARLAAHVQDASQQTGVSLPDDDGRRDSRSTRQAVAGPASERDS